jgi:hypothetical protein
MNIHTYHSIPYMMMTYVSISVHTQTVIALMGYLSHSLLFYIFGFYVSTTTKLLLFLQHVCTCLRKLEFYNLFLNDRVSLVVCVCLYVFIYMCVRVPQNECPQLW